MRGSLVRAITFINLDTQYENVGDALINRELLRLVEPHSEQLVVRVGGTPDSFRQNLELEREGVLQVDGLAGFLWRMVLARLRRRPVYWFLMPGGFHGECTGFYQLQLWRHNLLIALMRLIGVRVCQIGVSYERLGPNYLRMLRFRQRLAYAHRVRDAESLAYLQANAVPCDGVSPDLSFNLFDHAPTADGPIRTVCFSFRTDQYAGQFDDALRFAQEVRAALGDGVRYRVFAQVERDIAPGKRLAAEFGGTELAFDAAPGDIETCLRYYDGVDLVVTNRMHVLLMGASRCGRFIAGPLGRTNRKIYGLLAFLGLSDSGFDAAGQEAAAPRAQRIEAALGRRLDATAHRAALKADVAALFD